jgi:hypothetical protein
MNTNQSGGHGAYGAPNKAYLLPLFQWRLLAVVNVMKIGDFDFPAKVVSLRGGC